MCSRRWPESCSEHPVEAISFVHGFLLDYLMQALPRLGSRRKQFGFARLVARGIRVNLFTEGDIDPGEEGELRKALTFSVHGPLGLHKSVKNIAPGFPRLANAESDGNVMGVVF